MGIRALLGKSTHILVSCAALYATSSQAEIVFNCSLLSGSNALVSSGLNSNGSYGGLDIDVPTTEACNQSYSFSSMAHIDGAASVGYFSIVSSVTRNETSYIFDFSGTAYTAATAPDTDSGIYAESEGYVQSLLSFTADSAVRYSFTAKATGGTGNGGRFDNALSYTAFPGNSIVIGDDQDLGKEYSEQGILFPERASETLLINPEFVIRGSVAATSRVGLSDGGIAYPTVATDLGSSWSYRLVVTPVPEPATQWMLVAGMLFIMLWVRGRKRQLLMACRVKV